MGKQIEVTGHHLSFSIDLNSRKFSRFIAVLDPWYYKTIKGFGGKRVKNLVPYILGDSKRDFCVKPK